jgi:uncharacterized membrane protein
MSMMRQRSDRLAAAMRSARSQLSARARWTVALLFVGLLGATFAPVLLAALGCSCAAWERWVHGACGPFCHQLADRSLQLRGHVWPLCSRCSGMWLGITAGVALALLIPMQRRWSIGLGVAALGLLFSALEHAHELSTQASWPWARLVLGAMIFLGVTAAVSLDSLALLLALPRRLWRPRKGATHALPDKASSG